MIPRRLCSALRRKAGTFCIPGLEKSSSAGNITFVHTSVTINEQTYVNLEAIYRSQQVSMDPLLIWYGQLVLVRRVICSF